MEGREGGGREKGRVVREGTEERGSKGGRGVGGRERGCPHLPEMY